MYNLCNQSLNVIKDGFEEVGLFVWWYSFVCNEVRIGAALLVLLGLWWSNRSIGGNFSGDGGMGGFTGAIFCGL